MAGFVRARLPSVQWSSLVVGGGAHQPVCVGGVFTFLSYPSSGAHGMGWDGAPWSKVTGEGSLSRRGCLHCTT